MNILDQGLELMLFGMGTVFVFLTLLVVVTGVMSAVIRRALPETPAAVSEPVAVDTGLGQGASVAPQIDAKIIAAIHAAIQQHRARE